MMPLGGLLLALFVAWQVSAKAAADELNIQSSWFFKSWFRLLRWAVPISIAAISLQTFKKDAYPD